MPDLFLTLKRAHLLAAIMMAVATVINGLIHSKARNASPAAAGAMLSIVVTIDSKIMGPSLLVLPPSGGLLMWVAGYSFNTPWLLLGMALSILLIIACFFGGGLEHRLYDVARSAFNTDDTALPEKYERVFRTAAPIGGVALLMSLAALILMVFKP